MDVTLFPRPDVTKLWSGSLMPCPCCDIPIAVGRFFRSDRLTHTCGLSFYWNVEQDRIEVDNQELDRIRQRRRGWLWCAQCSREGKRLWCQARYASGTFTENLCPQHLEQKVL